MNLVADALCLPLQRASETPFQRRCGSVRCRRRIWHAPINSARAVIKCRNVFRADRLRVGRFALRPFRVTSCLLESRRPLLAASLCKLSERIQAFITVRVPRKKFDGIPRWAFIGLKQPPSNFLGGAENPITRCQAYSGYLRVEPNDFCGVDCRLLNRVDKKMYRFLNEESVEFLSIL